MYYFHGVNCNCHAECTLIILDLKIIKQNSMEYFFFVDILVVSCLKSPIIEIWYPTYYDYY